MEGGCLGLGSDCVTGTESASKDEEAESWMMSCKLRILKVKRQQTREARREAWNKSSLQSLEGTNLADALISDFQPPGL